MSTIVTRSGKGTPLTNTEVDANFTNLNTDKLELSGGTLTGNLSLGDNVKLQLGNQTDGDLQVYHDGNNSRVEDKGQGGLRLIGSNFVSLQSTSGENKIVATSNGAVTLYHDNSPKLATTSTGISISNDANFPDNGKAIFGAGDDLAIYHDGSNSHIRDQGTGNLQIEGQSDVKIMDNLGSTTMATFRKNGPVFLAHNNSTKFATSATGADITGVLTADGLTVLDGLAVFRNLDDSPVQFISGTSGDKEALTFERNGGAVKGSIEYQQSPIGFNIGTDTGHAFRLKTGGTQRLNIASNGDISFYNDSANQGFYWDSSTSSLGIGTTSVGTINSVPFGGIGLHVKQGTLGRIIAEGSARAELILNDSGTSTNLRAKFVKSDGGVLSLGSLDDNGTPRQHLAIDNAGAATFSGAVSSTGLTSNSTVNAYGSGSASLQWGDTSALGALSFDTSANPLIRSATNKPLVFQTSGANERMRIDSSGHLIVASTSAANATAGFRAYSGGNGAFTSSATSLSLNRLSSDGEILAFQKDTTAVGSIGASNTDLYIGSTDHGIKFHDTSNAIMPWIPSSNSADSSGTLDLGTSLYKFKDLYLSGTANANAIDIKSGSAIHGTITTSSSSLTLNARNTGILLFQSGGSEKMRLSGGNLLVGKTSTSSALTTAGVDLRPEGRSFMTRSAGPALYLSRTTSDGNIAEFYKDGIVGSIGTISGDLAIYSSTSGHNGLRLALGAVLPTNNTGVVADNSADLGSSLYKFKNLYLSGGVYLGGTGAANKLDDFEDGHLDSCKCWKLSYQQHIKCKVHKSRRYCHGNCVVKD